MSEIMLIDRKTKLSTSLVRGCNDAVVHVNALDSETAAVNVLILTEMQYRNHVLTHESCTVCAWHCRSCMLTPSKFVVVTTLVLCVMDQSPLLEFCLKSQLKYRLTPVTLHVQR